MQYVFVDAATSQYVGIDQSSGGYPYLTAHWTQVHVWDTIAKALDYRKLFTSEPWSLVAVKASLQGVEFQPVPNIQLAELGFDPATLGLRELTPAKVKPHLPALKFLERVAQQQKQLQAATAILMEALKDNKASPRPVTEDNDVAVLIPFSQLCEALLLLQDNIIEEQAIETVIVQLGGDCPRTKFLAVLTARAQLQEQRARLLCLLPHNPLGPYTAFSFQSFV